MIPTMDDQSKISCLLVDDDPAALSELSNKIKLIHQYSLLGTFTDPFDFQLAAATNNPDVLFLDIDMPKKNGIDLAISLRELNLSSKIIFVSNYSDFALRAIPVHPYDYLIKPVTSQDLTELASKLIRDRNGDQKPTGSTKIRFNTNNGFLLLESGKIMAIEAEGNYSLATMDNGDSHLFCSSLKNIERKISNSDLIRVSRSLLLNVSYLKSVDRRNLSCTLQSEFFEKTLNIQKVAIRKIEESLN